MKRRHCKFIFALTALILLAVCAISRPASAQQNTQTKARVAAAVQHIPLHFEANRGQTDRQAQFLARGSGYSLFLTPKEAVLVLRKTEGMKGRRDEGMRGRPKLNPQSAIRNPQSAVLRMQLLGANAHPKASGQERLPGQVNYFIGNDPKKWRTNVPTYQKVRYQAVYPGVDLVYYGSQQQLEYDFVVKPGENPRKISLAFEGAQRVRIDKSGELALKTSGGEVRWHKPLVYQEINGKRHAIAAKYVVRTPNTEHRTPTRIGFQVARYDTSRPLVIDPTLAYSTYLGGSGDEGANITVDGAGYVYVTGSTSSSDFPTKNAFQGYQGYAAFVTKLDPTQSGEAQLLYSTYLGGNGYDYCYGIAVDAAGYVYVAGGTDSTDFPTKNAYQGSKKGIGDAFVSKLDTTQSGAAQLLYSTYLGGSDQTGGEGESGLGIAVEGAGYVYVTGFTWSSDFPTKNAYQESKKGGRDVFVTKLDTTQSGAASLIYSTYLGGSADDAAFDIAVDGAGHVYMTGITPSTDFPTKNAYQDHLKGSFDAFVTKLDPTRSGAAQLLYSTYLGGSNSENGGDGIAVDGAGNAYVTGTTDSTDFPTKNAFQGDQGGEDAFVTKLDTTQSGAASLIYSTYLGGSSNDAGQRIAVDGAGYVYATGTTVSTDFPTKHAFQGYQGPDGYLDAFVTKLDPAQSGETSLVYSTYLGGNGDDGGYGIAVDAAGNAYVSGLTRSTDFPTKNQYQGYQGNSDVFVTKFAEGESPPALTALTLTPDRVGGGATSTGTVTLDSPPSADTVVTLASDNVAATVPDGVTVPAGSKSADFAISTSAVTSTQSAVISATLGSTTLTATLTIHPPIISLTLRPSTVVGCKNATGKVTLNGPASSTLTITLTNTNPAASVPGSILIPAGKTYKTFTITTTPVSEITTGTVTATYNGVSKSATLKVRPIYVKTITLTPNPVVGGNTVNGTVTLECEAGPGDIVVTLSSSKPSVASPTVSSITIAKGSTTGNFTVSTSVVSVASSATIKAKANGNTKSKKLTINP